MSGQVDEVPGWFAAGVLVVAVSVWVWRRRAVILEWLGWGRDG